MTVEGQGMPFHKKTYQNGNLIIQFKVKFPTKLDTKSVKLLTDALGGAVKAKKDEKVDETVELK